MCGVVCVILRLVVSVEHRLVIDGDRQTHHHGVHRASMASRGKNEMKAQKLQGCRTVATIKITQRPAIKLS